MKLMNAAFRRRHSIRWLASISLGLALIGLGSARGDFRPAGAAPDDSARGPVHSVARQWNEELLHAIRNDYARPTIHARNLYHTAVAMWDAWAAYDPVARTVITHENHTAVDVQAAREEAISFAAYRLLQHRFANAPGATEIMTSIDNRMDALGYDKTYTDTIGNSPASFGNRIAANMIAFGHSDGANEQNGYANQYYAPINPPLLPDFPGNPDIIDPNRWQPLALDYYKDQSGNPIPLGYPDFLSPEWGIVTTFSLDPADANIYHRDGFDYWVYHDPGPPPHLDGSGDADYKWGFEVVSIWSGHLDPTDGVMWDVSPATIGDCPLPAPGNEHQLYDRLGGGDWGVGWDLNPATGQPYQPQIVPRGDYARILAEFWADGPDSETPPGHWFVIANYVSDHPATVKRIGGQGPLVDDLEWDVKTYLVLGGAMHDVAVASWGVKGWYDFIRPVSAIRYLADNGQSTDPNGPSYHPDGIDLEPGWIEVVTAATTAPGQKHEHLAGNEGKIAIRAWRGHSYISDPSVDEAGVGWILAENWWPYQRPSFVTPPFAGYVSGHSTYSRAGARVMGLLTGSDYFPGGMGEFHCEMNEFLVFEEGPSMDVTLQWAKYVDASDQCSLSRIWGGIHPPADDIPGRRMGEIIGPEAYQHAEYFYHFTLADVNQDSAVDVFDLFGILRDWGACDAPCPPSCAGDVNGDCTVDQDDLMLLIQQWGTVNP